MNKDKKPLSETHPELAKQAFGWDPNQFTHGSHQIVKWKCKKDHKWSSEIKTRAIGGSNCPICSGRKVLKGFNDLATLYPEIAKLAFGWDPTTVTVMSGKKVSWKCKNGHVTEIVIASKVKGTDCSVCSGRKILIGFNDLKTTHPEIAKEADGWDPRKYTYASNTKLSWKCKLGHKFFATPANRNKKNNKGTNCPYCSGNKVKSSFNDLATTHPELAMEAYGWDPKKFSQGSDSIKKWICVKKHIYNSAIKNRTLGKGCPICVNKKVLKGFNDLATTHPELAKEAYGWDPTKVIAGSHKKLKWKCLKGHISEVSPSSRFQGKQSQSKISKCIYCTNQKSLKGFNDLATTHPELAKEAYGWDPTKVIAGSSKKMKWICQEKHIWEAAVTSRRKELKSPSNCPYCGNYFVFPGFNDLQSKFPNVANEADGWDPSKVLFGTANRKKWKCKEGHKWVTSVSNRTFKGTGCPSCAIYGYNADIEGYVYFLIHPKWEMYQIGITNAPKDRLGRHRKNGFEVLELRGPMDGHTAKELETALLQYLKSQKAYLSPEHVAGKFDGFTESWTIDSYKVNNLKELIDKASEAGY